MLFPCAWAQAISATNGSRRLLPNAVIDYSARDPGQRRQSRPTDMPMFDGVTDDMRAAYTDRIPLKRLGRPEEVVAAALFLASGGQLRRRCGAGGRRRHDRLSQRGGF